jgi:hypothetical protein
MDFAVPRELQDYLAEIDRFVEAKCDDLARPWPERPRNRLLGFEESFALVVRSRIGKTFTDVHRRRWRGWFAGRG